MKEFENIKNILHGGFKIEQADFFFKGDQVIVAGGPLKGLEGIVQDEVKATQEAVLEKDVKVAKIQTKAVKKRTKNYSSSEKIGVFYGSNTGNSEAICDRIQETLGEEIIDLFNVSDTDPNKILEYNHIIISCPTWYDGELQEDWIEFLPKIAALDLNGKKIVMFGMGDQEGYADYFLDALGIIAEDLIKAGAKIEGEWPAEGYDFNKSLGLKPDGKHFYGLGLDEENQSELHDARLEKWLEMLLSIFNITAEIVEEDN